jgi:hypothetical protein
MGDPGSLANLLRTRAKALARFSIWESVHPMRLTPAAAIAAIGTLYELLPPESRRRPVDPSGVTRMHGALRVLSRPRLFDQSSG